MATMTTHGERGIAATRTETAVSALVVVLRGIARIALGTERGAQPENERARTEASIGTGGTTHLLVDQVGKIAIVSLGALVAMPPTATRANNETRLLREATRSRWVNGIHAIATTIVVKVRQEEEVRTGEEAREVLVDRGREIRDLERIGWSLLERTGAGNAGATTHKGSNQISGRDIRECLLARGDTLPHRVLGPQNEQHLWIGGGIEEMHISRRSTESRTQRMGT